MTDVTRLRIEATLLWAVLCGVIALGFAAGKNVQVQSDHARRIEIAEHMLQSQQDIAAQTNVRLATMQASLDALVRLQDAGQFRSDATRLSTPRRTLPEASDETRP